MEFSEKSELNRIARTCECLLSPKHLKPHPQNPSHSDSKLIFPDTEESQNFPSDSRNCPESRPFPVAHSPTNLIIEKDNSFLIETHHNKKSSLTISLMQEEDKSPTFLPHQLKVLVYFFSSPLKLQLSLPSEITISGLLSKALLALKKTNFSALPNGLDASGYEVWLPEDESYMPDKDYVLDGNTRVADLSMSVFCVCARSGYVQKDSYKSSSVSMRRSLVKDKVIIKFYFEGTWAHFAVDPNDRLAEVLEPLMKKLFITSDLSEEMLEFRIFVGGTSEECPVDMGLMIKELGTNDIRLYRRKYADAPKMY